MPPLYIRSCPSLVIFKAVVFSWFINTYECFAAEAASAGGARPLLAWCSPLLDVEGLVDEDVPELPNVPTEAAGGTSIST